MTTIGEDIKTYAVAHTSTNSTGVNDYISGRMHQNRRPQGAGLSAIWYQRRDENEELTLDGTGGLKEVHFDIECIATSAAGSIDLADSFKSRFHGASGAIGNSTVQGAFVNDQDDSYIPKSIDSDEGLHVAALDLQLWYTT